MDVRADPTRQLVRLRGRSYVAFVFSPVVPIVEWLAEIDATLARSPGYFVGKPIVLDLASVDLSSAAIAHLLGSLNERSIRVLGIEGCEAARLTPNMPPLLTGGRHAPIQQVEPDMVLCGSESTDARTSLVPSALAEYLGWPGLTGAKKLEVDGSTIRVHRETENGYDVLEAEGPAVVSVVKGINEPRYPSFKGIMAAKSKPVTDYSLADLGIDSGEVGTAGATTEVVDFAPRPPRQAGQQVKDPGDGSAAVELADFLASHKFI